MKCYFCDNVETRQKVVHLHQYIKRTISVCDAHLEGSLPTEKRDELMDEFMEKIGSDYDKDGVPYWEKDITYVCNKCGKVTMIPYNQKIECKDCIYG